MLHYQDKNGYVTLRKATKVNQERYEVVYEIKNTEMGQHNYTIKQYNLANQKFDELAKRIKKVSV
jgi:hypothetical protein